MTLERFWIILVKRWMLIVICFLVVGIGTYIGSKLITPLYQSTILVQVALQAQNQSDVNSLLASDQLVQTESQLAVSNPVLQVVASHYKGLTSDQLAKEVTSTVRLNTQLFEVDVQNPSPTRAAALANDIAATLIAQQLKASQDNYTTAIQQIQTDLSNTQRQIGSNTTKLGQLEAQKAADSLNLPVLQQDPQLVKQEATLQAQINALQTKLNSLQQHYNDRQTVLAQLQLTEAQNSNFLRVVQAAEPGRTPVSPQVLLNTAAGLLAGMLLGILLAILFEQLDTRVRTVQVITQVLDWPVLTKVWQQDARKEALVNPANQGANVESYRILRTNIGFSTIDKPLHSLVVTSALPRDGKSVIAANLAIFMARVGKQTLLIDADLHRPTQHRLFNLPGDRMGLSNALLAFGLPGLSKPRTPSDFQFQNPALQALNSTTTDNLSLGPFVHPVGIPNLWVMPSGPLPPNPAELLDSKAMERFLVVIANCGVEVAIFDTPPLLGLSDASILASKVDGALAVIDMTRATKGKLEQLKAALAKTGVNVLGCVANKHRRSRNDSAYSYYYYQMDEQKRSEEQGGVDETTWHNEATHASSRGLQVRGAPLSPVSPSPYEQGKKSN
jgi:Mrp family chromosome partitioning ATPase/capsular polysaccharide biosynthesis protein